LDLILAEYRQRFQELAGMAKDDELVGPHLANSRQPGPMFKLTGQLASLHDAEGRPSKQA
jgi:hypothetical protein